MVVTCPDELVPATHEVRQVWAVVQAMDLAAFSVNVKAIKGGAGRNATDPALLVALWLYAAVRGIGSARELERRCNESAPFKWLCGGVGVNHHLLADFRVDQVVALDALFTCVLATLVSKKLVKVRRISQDGMRVRAAAGSSSFRREGTLKQLLEKTRTRVTELRKMLDDPSTSATTAAHRHAAQLARARNIQQRTEAAIAQLPDLEKRREKAVKNAGNGERGKKILAKELRVSTTDPEARVMKMANGGFNPASNVQVATDNESRAIVGVEVTNEGSDSANLAGPMREQVEQRTGLKPGAQLIDGGYVRTEDIENTHQNEIELYMPPKTALAKASKGNELHPKPGDSPAILAWKARMASDEGKTIYKERASTAETTNAHLRAAMGMDRLLVRGIKKTKCVILWCALAINVMRFAVHLIG